ncbi:MFS transporter [Pseudarthrobacter sp. BIM B-2242]|uniref:MFS transporter n=1 Tax=Pseudarthrobacter sp. BIM B-2242 TaxID=2772401 RepID=UPI00168AC92C|nr:MFS transporter [Pseudarthrobacter sp. BIM B-2242]QOD02680.1 MFS transporter [Pseudarthrobacter sp. BIM B-2242]
MDLRERINTSKMSPYQWAIIGMCVLLNALDGFDVLAMAFTANGVTKEFGLTGSELGILLSAGLVGMAIGSLCLAPLADIIGRRPMIIASVGAAGAGMLLAATATTMEQLGIWRLLTGLGVGCILACTNVIASEYSSKKRRGLSISIYTAGYGIGATLGGAAAVYLQSQYGWRSVFVFGGVSTLSILLVLLFLLPESVDFLVTKRPRNVLDRLNRIARKTGHPEVTALPDVQAVAKAKTNPVSDLLSPANRRSTLLLWLAFFTTMFGFYFVNSWTPRLLVTAGMTESQGITGGLMLTLGGIFGAVLYGVLATKWNSKIVLVAFTVLSAVMIVVFISSASIIVLALGAGVLVGMLINGCIAGLYTLAPSLYPASVRSTGVGWGIGIGRIGAIIAPLITGALLDASWSAVQLYLAVGAVVLISAVAVGMIRSKEPVKSPASAEELTGV